MGYPALCPGEPETTKRKKNVYHRSYWNWMVKKTRTFHYHFTCLLSFKIVVVVVVVVDVVAVEAVVVMVVLTH